MLRNGVIAHHSGEFFRANREARNDEEYVFLNLNRLTTFLLNKSEFETLELLCSKIYNYIRFDDPLQIEISKLEDLTFQLEPINQVNNS